MQKTQLRLICNFEIICYSYVVKALHYHAYDGIFDTNKFKEACNIEKQNLIFCGVNTHHQNGKSENRIKHVTIGAKINPTHATNFWLNGIHSSLCRDLINIYVKLRKSIPTNFKPETYHGRNKIPETYDSPASKIIRF